MKPMVKPPDRGVEELFRSQLTNIINLRHELVRRRELVDWGRLEAYFAPYYREAGPAGLPIRLAPGLHLPKHSEGLSDEVMRERWERDLYMRYFCGEDCVCADPTCAWRRRAAMKTGRYLHAEQKKRARRRLKFMRVRLPRLLRDIRRSNGFCIVGAAGETAGDRVRQGLAHCAAAARRFLVRQPNGYRRLWTAIDECQLVGSVT
jgi:Transposase domain (DUF772)